MSCKTDCPQHIGGVAGERLSSQVCTEFAAAEALAAPGGEQHQRDLIGLHAQIDGPGCHATCQATAS